MERTLFLLWSFQVSANPALRGYPHQVLTGTSCLSERTHAYTGVVVCQTSKGSLLTDYNTSFRSGVVMKETVRGVCVYVGSKTICSSSSVHFTNQPQKVNVMLLFGHTLYTPLHCWKLSKGILSSLIHHTQHILYSTIQGGSLSESTLLNVIVMLPSP